MHSHFSPGSLLARSRSSPIIRTSPLCMHTCRAFTSLALHMTISYVCAHTAWKTEKERPRCVSRCCSSRFILCAHAHARTLPTYRYSKREKETEVFRPAARRRVPHRTAAARACVCVRLCRSLRERLPPPLSRTRAAAAARRRSQPASGRARASRASPVRDRRVARKEKERECIYIYTHTHRHNTFLTGFVWYLPITKQCSARLDINTYCTCRPPVRRSVRSWE